MTSIRAGDGYGGGSGDNGSDENALINWRKIDADGNVTYNNKDKTGEGYNTAIINPNFAVNTAEPYTKIEKLYGEYKPEALAIEKWKLLINNITTKIGEIESRIDKDKVNTAFSDAKNSIGTIKKGYSEADLNRMAQNGFDLLKEAYNDAIAKAQANYNRLGLRGSGFEIAAEFGKQNDSITAIYLKNVRQLNNEIAVKGLEAEREDSRNIFQIHLAYANALNQSDLQWLQNFEESVLKVLLENESIHQKWAELNGKEAQADFENIRKILEYFGEITTRNLDRTSKLREATIQAVGLAGQGGSDAVNTLSNALNSSESKWAKLIYESMNNLNGDSGDSNITS